MKPCILVAGTNFFEKHTLYFFRRRDFTLEDGNDKLFLNVDKKLPLHSA